MHDVVSAPSRVLLRAGECAQLWLLGARRREANGCIEAASSAFCHGSGIAASCLQSSREGSHYELLAVCEQCAGRRAGGGKQGQRPHSRRQVSARWRAAGTRRAASGSHTQTLLSTALLPLPQPHNHDAPHCSSAGPRARLGVGAGSHQGRRRQPQPARLQAGRRQPHRRARGFGKRSAGGPTRCRWQAAQRR